MYLGIDLGTSAVKAVVTAEDGTIQAESSADLSVSRPSPKYSEQDPSAWLIAVDDAVAQLSAYSHRIRAIGLSGQMHGAVLLDRRDRVLRPAILWNDGRAETECAELEARVELLKITGNCAMPGFTAPKLLWVKRHEPDIFASIAKVLLPKDYVRLALTGTYASDMSDASGSLWLDVGNRSWSEEILAACDLGPAHMPELFEGSDVTGVLTEECASKWSMDRVPVVGGAGDQAAGAVGAGAVAPGRGTISLGTSGVIFVPDFEFKPYPEGGVHAFCHALPGAWHQMAVMLSAASCLSWATNLLGYESESALVAAVETANRMPDSTFFLPYLSGERTPHNDPNALGAFIGLNHDTDRVSLAYAVLEGVALAFRDCTESLDQAGTTLDRLNVIGGGSRSPYWGSLLASAMGLSLTYREDAAVGPARGAARLAILGTTGRSVNEVCGESPVASEVDPDPRLAELLNDRFAAFRELYSQLRGSFPKLIDASPH